MIINAFQCEYVSKTSTTTTKQDDLPLQVGHGHMILVQQDIEINTCIWQTHLNQNDNCGSAPQKKDERRPKGDNHCFSCHLNNIISM